jgi:hypothetical protein
LGGRHGHLTRFMHFGAVFSQIFDYSLRVF